MMQLSTSYLSDMMEIYQMLYLSKTNDFAILKNINRLKIAGHVM